MSEVPLTAGRASAFQRLKSIKVGGKRRETEDWPGEKSAPEETDELVKIAMTLGPLEYSVANLEESKEVIRQIIGPEEVARSNREASQVSVRDLDQAVLLAEEVARRIMSYPNDAHEAQEGLQASTVQNLLR